jgi:hypothetical protein
MCCLVFDVMRLYDAAYWATILCDSPFDVQVLEGIRFPELADKAAVTSALRHKKPSLLNLDV